MASYPQPPYPTGGSPIPPQAANQHYNGPSSHSSPMPSPFEQPGQHFPHHQQQQGHLPTIPQNAPMPQSPMQNPQQPPAYQQPPYQGQQFPQQPQLLQPAYPNAPTSAYPLGEPGMQNGQRPYMDPRRMSQSSQMSHQSHRSGRSHRSHRSSKSSTRHYDTDSDLDSESERERRHHKKHHHHHHHKDKVEERRPTFGDSVFAIYDKFMGK